MKVLTIGAAMRDVFIQYPNPESVVLETSRGSRCFLILEEGRKIEVQQLRYHTGGGATNTAISFKRLDFSVSSFFKIGDDQEGEFILRGLHHEDIITNDIVRTNNVGTGTSFIIPCPSGERTVLVYRGANLTLKKDELPIDAIATTTQVYITSLSGRTAKFLLPIAKEAKKHKRYVATNPGTSQLQAGADDLRKALPFIDTLILNAYETKLLMASLVQQSKELQQEILQNDPKKQNPSLPPLLQSPIRYENIYFTLKQYFKTVLFTGPQIVVVTNGADGVYVATKDNLYYHPSLSIKVVSTVGAGDAYGSCFIASLLHGKSVQEAMIRGIINSASVISYLNTTQGLLNKKQLDEQFSKIGLSGLQNF